MGTSVDGLHKRLRFDVTIDFRPRKLAPRLNRSIGRP